MALDRQDRLIVAATHFPTLRTRFRNPERIYYTTDIADGLLREFYGDKVFVEHVLLVRRIRESVRTALRLMAERGLVVEIKVTQYITGYQLA